MRARRRHRNQERKAWIGLRLNANRWKVLRFEPAQLEDEEDSSFLGRQW
jgi:hypothetical protein